MALTKAQIVETTCSQIGFSKNKSSEVVKTLLEIIKSRVINFLKQRHVCVPTVDEIRKKVRMI